LLTTGYGAALLVKILLVAGLLGLAAWNRFQIVPALQEGDLAAAMRLRRTINHEILVALAILVMSSLLTSSLTLPLGDMG
jgi:putative copper resistance protein D